MRPTDRRHITAKYLMLQPFDLIGVDLIAGNLALELLEAVNNAKVSVANWLWKFERENNFYPMLVIFCTLANELLVSW